MPEKNFKFTSFVIDQIVLSTFQAISQGVIIQWLSSYAMQKNKLAGVFIIKYSSANKCGVDLFFVRNICNFAVK